MKLKKVILMALMMVMYGVISYSAETTLRTEFQDTQPKYIKNSNKSFSGICVELMNLISKDTGIKFVYPADFVPTKRIASDLESGETDIHFGLKKTEERKKTMIFSEPMYTVSYVVLARKDDTLKINSLDELKKFKKEDTILSVFGTGSTDFLKNSENLTIDAGGTDVETNIKKLATGRGRVFVSYDLALYYELKRNSDKDKVKVVGKGFEPYEQYVVFSKKADPKLIEKVSNSIKKLKANGEWQKIVDKYLSE